MEPRTLLRLEGVAAFAVALGGYLTVGGPLWLLVVLALAPDLSMVGYLVDSRIGSYCYNIAHTYTLPVVLGVLGVWTATELVLLVALVWAAHIGADRAVGYGLKYPTGFRETHLSVQPSPSTAFTNNER